MEDTMEQMAVEIKDLSKSFGSVCANRHISLDLKKGEILALLGENGSGKSTLVNMLSGIYSPESGFITVNGKICNFASPQDAISEGIGMVHQHFKLVEVMSALENITLGDKDGFFLNRKKIRDRIINLEKQFGFMIDPDKKIYSMSVSEKQTVEIIKILYQGAKVLILDEPTAVLTPQETDKLFEILLRMKKEGCSVIIITHKLGEVMRISDRVTVLRKGKLSGTVITSQTNQQQLAEMMVGSSFSLEIKRENAVKSTEPMLNVNNLTVQNVVGKKVLDDLSFNLYGGEILGVAGIVGSGQKEICETITGMMKATSGSVMFLGDELLELTPLEIKKRGVHMNFVPEDRLGMGLVAGMDITDNILLRSYNNNRGIFVNRVNGKKKAEEIVEKYDIVTPSIHHIVRQLSGGNIQKVLLGRELDMKPKLLIASYPFRGLDVGATNTIIGMLNEQKKNGVAILLIAEDLDQMCALCDRLIVLHDGKLMGMLSAENAIKEEIGLMMMGQRKGEAE